jgi:hypothetical protein
LPRLAEVIRSQTGGWRNSPFVHPTRRVQFNESSPTQSRVYLWQFLIRNGLISRTRFSRH